MSIDEISNQHSFLFDEGLNPNQRTIIKVIGVGGGGGNAVKYMYEQGVKDVAFVVCNTDAQALRKSPVPTKVLLGTSGLGAGNIPERACREAEDSIEKINALFDDDTKMVFITAGMGGGTGTGAGPVVARAAKEKGVLTIGIVTIPFMFEGNPKILQALDGVDEMRKYVDAMLVINNDRLAEIYPDLTVLNGFAKADETLSTAARSISEIITIDGIMNLDFNDVDTTLRNGGAAIISSGIGSGEKRLTKAIADALNSPLLKNRDIMNSKRLLFNITFAEQTENPFKMSEVAELNEFISTLTSGPNVIWGMANDDSLGDQVKITILASGFTETTDALRPSPTMAKNIQNLSNPTERIASIYGDKKTEVMQTAKDRARFVILSQEQLNDDSILEKLEQSPAYNRDKQKADEIKNSTKPVSADIDAAEQELQTPVADSRYMPKENQCGTSASVIDFSSDN